MANMYGSVVNQIILTEEVKEYMPMKYEEIIKKIPGRVYDKDYTVKDFIECECKNFMRNYGVDPYHCEFFDLQLEYGYEPKRAATYNYYFEGSEFLQILVNFKVYDRYHAFYEVNTSLDRIWGLYSDAKKDGYDFGYIDCYKREE